MPPAKPAKKRGPKPGSQAKPKAKAKGKSATAKAPKKPGPRKNASCHTCGARIRIPEGWTVGPAVRRHYWAKHRDVMQPDAKKEAR